MYKQRSNKVSKIMNYISQNIIEALRTKGLDEAYLADKTNRLKDLTKDESLVWACQYLDDEALAIFGERLGVNAKDLRTVGIVFSQI